MGFFLARFTRWFELLALAVLFLGVTGAIGNAAASCVLPSQWVLLTFPTSEPGAGVSSSASSQTVHENTLPLVSIAATRPLDVECSDDIPSVNVHLSSSGKNAPTRLCGSSHSDALPLCSASALFSTTKQAGAKSPATTLCYRDLSVRPNTGYVLYGLTSGSSTVPVQDGSKSPLVTGDMLPTPLYFVGDSDIAHRSLKLHHHHHGEEEGGKHIGVPRSKKGGMWNWVRNSFDFGGDAANSMVSLDHSHGHGVHSQQTLTTAAAEEEGGGAMSDSARDRTVSLSFVIPSGFSHVMVRRNTNINTIAENNNHQLGFLASGGNLIGGGVDTSTSAVYSLFDAQKRIFGAAATPEEIARDRGIVVTKHQHLDPLGTRTVTFLASGYTAGDMAKFLADVNTATNILRTEGVSRYSPSPWDRYYYLLNIYSVFEPSVDSGASRPQGPGFNCPNYMNDCGPRTVANNLDCAYGTPTPSRLGCSYEKSKALASFAPASDIIVVLVNDNDYGGTGSDRFCVLSVGSGDFPFLLLHEIAHSVGMLGDEYTYGFSDKSGTVPLSNCIPSAASANIPEAWRYYITNGQVPATPFTGCSFDNYFRPTSDKCYMGSGEPTTLCPVCLNAMAARMLTVGPGLNLAAPMCPPSSFDVYLSNTESATLSLNHRFILLNNEVFVTWTFPGGATVSGVPAVTVEGSALTSRTNIITVVVEDKSSLMNGQRPARATQTFEFRIIKMGPSETPAGLGLTANACVASTGVTYNYNGLCRSSDGCTRETVISLYEANIRGSITEDDATNAVKATAGAFAVVGAVAIAIAVGIIIYRKSTNPQSVYEFSTSARAVWISSTVFSLFVLVAVCCMLVYVAQYLPQTVIFGDALFIGGLVIAILIYLSALGTFVSILTLSTFFNVLCSIFLALFAIAIFIISVVMLDLAVNRTEKDVVDKFAGYWRSAVESDASLVCSLQEYFSCSGYYYACSPVFSEYCPANCDVQNRNPNACLTVWQAFVWDKLRPAAICGIALAFLMVVTSILTTVLCVLKRKATANAIGRRSHRKDPHAPVRALTASEKRQLRYEFAKADKNDSGTLEGEEVLVFVKAVFPGDALALDEAEALASGGPKTFNEIVDAYFPYLSKQGSNPQLLTKKEAEEAESLVELHRMRTAKLDKFIEASGALSPEALEAIYSRHRRRKNKLSTNAASPPRPYTHTDSPNVPSGTNDSAFVYTPNNASSSLRSPSSSKRKAASERGGALIIRNEVEGETGSRAMSDRGDGDALILQARDGYHDGDAADYDIDDTAALLQDIRSAAAAYSKTTEGQMFRGLSPQELEGIRAAWRNLHPTINGPLTDPEIDRYFQWSHEAILESREHFVRWKQMLNIRGTGTINWPEFCFPYAQRALLKAAKEALVAEGKDVTMPGAHLNRAAAVADFGEACAERVFMPYEQDVPIERLAAMALVLLDEK